MVHAGKLGQVTITNFTIVGGTAQHCINQYMVLFHHCSIEGDTMPGGLHARLCHAFLVLSEGVQSQTFAAHGQWHTVPYCGPTESKHHSNNNISTATL